MKVRIDVFLDKNRVQALDFEFAEGEGGTLGKEGTLVVLPKSLKVSRSHGTIHFDGTKLQYNDHSKNGTFVNREVFKSGPLKQGDVIQIGDYLLRLTRMESVDPESAAPSESESSAPVDATFDPTVSALFTDGAAISPPPPPMQAPEAVEVLSDETGGPWSLEQFGRDWRVYREFYRWIALNWKNFYQNLSWDGGAGRSLLFILLFSGVPVLLADFIQSPRLGFYSLPKIVILTLVVSLVKAALFQGSHAILEAQGNFKQYLRFDAFMSLVLAPVTLLAGILPGGVILSIFPAVVTLYFFVKVFHAKPLPTLLIAAAWALMVVLVFEGPCISMMPGTGGGIGKVSWISPSLRPWACPQIVLLRKKDKIRPQ
jgi:pSer/pThr/pTyr-binding forkhead associated (FHA) protein